MAIDSIYGQGIDASASTGPPAYAYDVLYDYDGNGNLIYIGYALSSPTPSGIAGMVAQTSVIPSTGPIASGSYWAIKKLIYNGSNQLIQAQWANGNTQAINSWNLRTTLSYQ
jgi:hypothetical protein